MIKTGVKSLILIFLSKPFLRGCVLYTLTTAFPGGGFHWTLGFHTGSLDQFLVVRFGSEALDADPVPLGNVDVLEGRVVALEVEGGGAGVAADQRPALAAAVAAVVVVALAWPLEVRVHLGKCRLCLIK